MSALNICQKHSSLELRHVLGPGTNATCASRTPKALLNFLRGTGLIDHTGSSSSRLALASPLLLLYSNKHYYYCDNLVVMCFVYVAYQRCALCISFHISSYSSGVAR